MTARSDAPIRIRRTRARIVGPGARAAILMLCLLGLAGCLTPEERHRILTFLFDDVPPLGGEVPDEIAEAERETLPPDARRPGRLGRPVRIHAHGPWVRKACEECHSDRRSKQLVAEGESLCFSCHEETEFPGSVVHPPVAAGQCVGCHHPHRSEQPLMLVAERATLCDYCHDADTFPDREAHRLDQGEDCLGCHDPHAADREYMLVKAEAPPP